jgi:hypothetical protein
VFNGSPLSLKDYSNWSLFPNVHVACRWPPGYLGVYFWLDYFDFVVRMKHYSITVKRVNNIWITTNERVDRIVEIRADTDTITLFGCTIVNGKIISQKSDIGQWVKVSKGYNFTITYKGSAVSTPFIVHQSPNHLYMDNCIDPVRMSGYWYNLKDIIVFCRFDEDGIDRGVKECGSFDMNHPLMNLWMMRADLPLNTYIQTWINSQTHLTRFITVKVRDIYGLNDDSLHVFRRLSCRLMYKDCVIIHDKRINAKLGNSYIACAGHLVNMLLACTVGQVDIRRYLDTIEGNVIDNAKSDPSFSLKLKKFRDEGRLAESNWLTKDALWHSFYDYYTACGAYIMMCVALKLPIHIYALTYTVRRLFSILKKYKNFANNSWEAKKYLEERASSKKKTKK